jgi:hypothetical protein
MNPKEFKSALTEITTASLQGHQLSSEEFVKWIEDAEKVAVLPLHEAKSNWANKRQQLEKISMIIPRKTI